MKNISITDNVIFLDGVAIPLKYGISEYIQIDNVIAVCLEARAREDDVNNNIYGIIDGKVAWRVQDMLDYDENCAPFLPDPYTWIEVYDENPALFIATSFQGFRFLIDPKTGRIVGRESTVK